MLKKYTQINILNQFKKRVKINKIAINIYNLEINNLKIISNITIAL